MPGLSSSPGRRWDTFVLVVSLVVLAASIVLDGSTEHVELFGRVLPPSCTFQRLTGIDCPGCGLTRSFVFMGAASPLEAFKMHVFGPLIWTLVAAQVPLRIVRLWRNRPAA